MVQKPRPFTTTFFNMQELRTSIIQGLAVTLGTLLIYQFAVQQDYNEDVTRTMVFITLIGANVFLTLVNRSFYFSIFATLGYRNNLVLLIILITVILTASLLVIPAITHFFKFQTLSWPQLLVSITIGAASVIWFEVVKGFKRRRDNARFKEPEFQR